MYILSYEEWRASWLNLAYDIGVVGRDWMLLIKVDGELKKYRWNLFPSFVCVYEVV